MKRWTMFVLATLSMIFFGCSADVNVTKCEINVRQGNTDIPNGSGYFNFGNIPLQYAQTITFTIENIGFCDLELNGTPIIDVSGKDFLDFAVIADTTDSVISAGNYTDFSIYFHPSSLGKKTATISIENDDRDENPYTFVVVGTCTPPAPEIHVKQETSDIMCTTGSYDFGTVNVGKESSVITFTIENNGNEDLTLTGIQDKISLIGTDTAMFLIFQDQIQSTVKPGHSTSFDITFAPTSAGIKIAKISILNDDSDENPYIFSIKGTAVASPEINVKQGSENLLSGTGNYYFVNTLVYESTEVVFTIENLGTATLHVDSIGIVGSDAAMFSENTMSTEKYIPHGNSTTFSIVFAPTSNGLKTATVSIANNDDDENPYTFKITGTCLVPDIYVKQGITQIPNSTGSFDFGLVYVGFSSQVIVFTIGNIDSGDLKLTGTPKIAVTGTDSSMFIIDENATSSTIANGVTTTFTITFTPTSAGNKSATVSIANNDPDENPFTFTVKGQSEIAVPEINVKQDSDNIANSTGEYYFAGVKVNNSSAEIEFTIQNLGTGNLHLTGSTVVEMTGTNASEFTLNTNGIQTMITPGSSTTFKIKYKPQSLGLKSATISIENDDSDEDPYTFKIYGFGVVYTEGDVNGDGLPDTVVGAVGNDTGGSEAGSAYVFFGKQNWNSSYNASNADIKLVGEDAGDHFGASVTLAGDINDDGFEDILIGAYVDDDGGSSSGCAFIFLGRYNWTSVVDASNASVKLVGARSGDHFGTGVSALKDVNNDGIDDIIVGAPESNSNKGSAFVFFGRTNWNAVVDADDANIGFGGSYSNAYFGIALTTGDVNKDGLQDIIIGEYKYSYQPTNRMYLGRIYVFLGRQTWQSGYNSSRAEITITGDNVYDYFGEYLSCSGDINNDGFDDIIVGAVGNGSSTNDSGFAYIFFGRSSWNSNYDAKNADVKMMSSNHLDFLGCSISINEDINDDGIEDLIVGARYNDLGASESGAAFIFFGRTNWSTINNVSQADVQLVGAGEDDYFGWSLSIIQDINSDGIADVIVGALQDDDGGSNSGCAFIFFGRRSWVSTIDASNANVKFVGEASSDGIGISVSRK